MTLPGALLLVLAIPPLSGGSALPSPPPPQSGFGYVGEFRVTYYYVAEEDHRFDQRARVEQLLDVNGGLLAWVSREFRTELDREGTGRLRDGRILNVATKREGRWRYEQLKPGTWGRGAGGELLEPFVSVASDPHWLPLGTRILLPELVGLICPDGSEHPGVFRVVDTGSAIRGGRIDVFLGRSTHLARAEARVPSHAATPVFRLAPGCPGERP